MLRRTNLVLDPRCTALWNGTATGTNTLTYETSGGPDGVATWAKNTLNAAGVGGFRTISQSAGTANFATVMPGATYLLSASILHSHTPATRVSLYVTWYDAAAAVVGQDIPQQSAGPNGQWYAIASTFTAPAGAVYARIGVSIGTDTGWPVGAYIGMSKVMMLDAASGAATPYFDGSFVPAPQPDGTTLVYAWTGAANASASTETVVPAPITATPDVARGRVALEVYGGPPDSALYIFRRSTSGGGVDIVRDTSEGTAGFPALEEEARNLIINPKPTGSLTGWEGGSTASLLSITEDGVRLSLGPASLTNSAIVRAVPGDGSVAFPVTVGQTVRLTSQHDAAADATFTTRLVGVDSAGASTGIIAADTWAGTVGASKAVDISGVVAAAGTVAVRAEVFVARAGEPNAARGSSFENADEVNAMIPISSIAFDQSSAWASQGSSSLLATVGIPVTSNAALQTAMGTPVVGKWYGLAVDVRLVTGTVWLRPALLFRNASGTLIGSVIFGTNTQLVAGTTHRLTVQGVVPAGTARVDHGVYAYSNSSTGQIAAGASWRMDGWMVAANRDTQALATSGAATFAPTMLGPLLDTRSWMLRQGPPLSVTGDYFDGDSVSPDPAYGYDWLGEPDASPSVYGRFVPSVIYDYEPIQGDAVDYILADDDGNQLASVRVTIPRWGTWLKSPGRPSRNLRCMFGKVDAIGAPLAREVYNVDESGQVVVYAARRSSERAGTLTLITRTAADVAAMRLLLSDGATLMLDVDPAWNVGLRYIAVGDVQRTRPLEAADGYMNLTANARLWELADTISQPSPQGASVTDPGRTYAVIPATYATYVGIPATVSTYEALATGEA